MENIQSPYEKDLDVTRTIFLLEIAPSSGLYQEIMLTHEVANKLRDVVCEYYGKNPRPDGFWKIPCSDTIVKFNEGRGEFSLEEIQKQLLDD